ncbi:MAG: hypothetical protein AAFV62_14600, partial [Pseudomonadota bacterium]
MDAQRNPKSPDPLPPGPPQRDDFFIGYIGRIPRDTVGTLLLGLVLFVVGFLGAGIAIALTQDDPGPGRFAGRATLEGVIYAEPYPHLRMPSTPDNARGQTVPLMKANGKYGVQDAAALYDGKPVRVEGVRVRRGDIEMLLVREAQGKALIAPLSGQPFPVLSVIDDLGRWRLSGEICDGKCYAGVMKPGRGLAHKACANLCIQGGVPPVFVASDDAAGSEFFLLAAE